MNLRAKFRILAGQFRERFDRALSVIGYRFVKEAALTAFPVPTLIEHLFSNGEEVFFLQIGANDGVQGDHLTRFRGRSAWSGLLLEPNPVVFSRLAKNVAKTGNPRVQALQVALADKDAILPFFVVDDEKKRAFASLPQATDTWSSLSRETLEGLIRKYGVSLEQAAGLIAEIPVKALTFESLLESREISRVDLLMMDVEGLDATLLPLFPLERFLPRLVICERDKMSNADLARIRSRFHDAGYSFLAVGHDAVFLRACSELWVCK